MSPGDVASVTGLARLVDADRRLAGELGKDYTRTWVASSDVGSIVSYLLAWHVADELQIVDIVTTLHARRKGAARALLGVAKEHAESSGCRIMLLEVREDNLAAQALYSSFGFRPTRTRAGYYEGGARAVEMELEL